MVGKDCEGAKPPAALSRRLMYAMLIPGMPQRRDVLRHVSMCAWPNTAPRYAPTPDAGQAPQRPNHI